VLAVGRVQYKYIFFFCTNPTNTDLHGKGSLHLARINSKNPIVNIANEFVVVGTEIHEQH
jgi:hypothetical protein